MAALTRIASVLFLLGCVAARAANVATMAAGGIMLTTSGDYDSAWSGPNLVDGDPKTGWCSPSGKAFPATFLIELNQAHRLNSIALDTTHAQESSHPGISARGVEIWVSNASPSSGFSRIVAVEVPKGSRREVALSGQPLAQWVRIVVTSNWGHARYTELMEIEVDGQPSGPAPAPPPMSGSFDTNEGPLTLRASGSLIAGCYSGGTVSGVISGRTIQAQWRNLTNRDRFGGALLVLNRDGELLSGVWYLRGEPMGKWSGKRRSSPFPCTVTVDDAMSEVAAGGRSILYGIRFASDSATVSADSKATLDKLETLLRSNPTLRIVIEGHTDSTNTAAYNEALSQKRAGAVSAWLVKQGISKSRIKTAGYGASRPIADNTTPQGRALNRRVEIAAQ